MSFKLLAIRPLADCDSHFLKNLQENYIYRFYNEYDYIYKKNIKDMSFIELQKQNQLQDRTLYYNIDSISFKQEVPNLFYRKNVSVTAIVGKNGSGKSSLLELLYAFIFNVSKKSSILKFENSEINYNQINLELYYLFNNEYYKISHKYKSSTSVVTKVYKLDENSKFIVSKSPNETIFKFYSLVVNYSIYGLNSKVSGKWIEKLFHKNDGYQTPIVINPFRNEGNIDINNEYNLAQARLILNHFVIKNNNLVDNIELHEVNYFLNIKESQFIEDETFPGEKTKLIINDIISFLDVNNFGGLNRFSQLIEIIFTENKKNKQVEALKKFLQGKDKDKEFHIRELSDNFKIEISYLCFLYIFKKLKRISYNYDEYTKYNFLFNLTWNNDIFKEELNKFKRNFRKKVGLKIGEDNINVTKYEDQLSESFRLFVKNNSILNTLLNTINHDIKLEIDNVLQSFVIEKDSALDNVIELVFENLTDIVDLHRIDLFRKYIKDVTSDDTHVAFKFRQALNYFYKDIFGKLQMKSAKDENKKVIPQLYNILIDQKLLSTSEIHNIPISFFEPEILVKKNEKIYPFNRLSSGEQQMIHSLLNITYHLYNITSVKKSKRKKKYEDINIIFDEVELYFHPEFQRGFINNLINSIQYFSNLNFNIIFSTHSPFILSDIPSQNILRLKEGIAVNDPDGYNSFGANIHDLLSDEFFLEGNTMGAFASIKIDKIIEFLFLKNKILELEDSAQNKIFSYSLRSNMEKEVTIFKNKLKNNDNYTSNQILEVAELIGEPLIKNKIKEMVRIIFNI
ncbi:ATP-binding protein [Elizabethkingia meningoseptica]|uniref:AAA family ATPase n=1 Tax=Elizabethkingia meningoseptica TaxID=238 RepID=UPI0023B180C2|nr:AAA family ATPase [Elizabethkingia meningoseptica]MDE5469906.1 ATP-binding protein [Elizabethkingia meningoseptica]